MTVNGGRSNSMLQDLLSIGLPFPLWAAEIFGDLVVVLFHPDGGLDSVGQFHNLRAYRPDGFEEWAAELPTSTSSDCFVSLTVGDLRAVHARSFSGYRCMIDSRTGDLLTTEFTK
jgi:hypothetical protein